MEDSKIKRVWIENYFSKEKNQRPIKQTGYRLGECIYIPEKLEERNHKYISELSKGDVIIHLIDKKIIGAASIVESGIIDEKIINEEKLIYVKLHNKININNPIIIKDELFNIENHHLLREIQQISEVFFTKNFGIKKNAYITPCSKYFLTMLNNLYQIKTGLVLNHINNKMVLPYDNSGLLEHINKNKKDIQIEYASLGSDKGKHFKK